MLFDFSWYTRPACQHPLGPFSGICSVLKFQALIYFCWLLTLSSRHNAGESPAKRTFSLNVELLVCFGPSPSLTARPKRPQSTTACATLPCLQPSVWSHSGWREKKFWTMLDKTGISLARCHFWDLRGKEARILAYTHICIQFPNQKKNNKKIQWSFIQFDQFIKTRNKEEKCKKWASWLGWLAMWLYCWAPSWSHDVRMWTAWWRGLLENSLVCSLLLALFGEGSNEVQLYIIGVWWILGEVSDLRPSDSRFNVNAIQFWCGIVGHWWALSFEWDAVCCMYV